MQLPSVYSIENEYQLLSEVLKYPEYREVSCWLTINDIINLRFYAQYYFQQLGGSEDLNSKLISCLNKNLDAKSDLFTIDANIPPFVQSYGGIIPNLSDAKTFETFQFFISAYESEGVKAKTTAYIATHFDDGVTKESALNYMQMPSVYSIENEYQLLSEVLKYPEYREVSCWLTINDIINLRFYAQYYFQQLGGSYFINKIAGFNPSKSLVATKLELIKVSDKSPSTPPNTEYYVDGVNDGFTDGINDLFY